MRHALDIDHIAAILAFTAGENASLRRSMVLGGVWGIGHATALLLLCVAVLLFELQLSADLLTVIEFTVGVTLVVLALDIFRRLGRIIVHKHPHHHADSPTHMHFHAHLRDGSGVHPAHNHTHPDGSLLRALLVGFLHGMAGTAFLVLLVLQSSTSAAVSLSYIALFGLGSMIGMIALSLVIAVPIRRSRYFSAGMNRSIRGAAALITLIVGIVLMMKTGAEVGILVAT